MPYIRRSPYNDGPFLSCCCEGKSGGSLWNEFDKQLLFSLWKAIVLRRIIFRISSTSSLPPTPTWLLLGLNRKNPPKYHQETPGSVGHYWNLVSEPEIPGLWLWLVKKTCRNSESSKILVWSTWKSSPKRKKRWRCLVKDMKDVWETWNHYMESILGGGVFPQHGQQVATSKWRSKNCFQSNVSSVGNHHSEVTCHTVDGKKLHHPPNM